MKKGNYTSSQDAIDSLIKRLGKDKKLLKLLLASLDQAKTSGKKELRKKLFKALDWPTSEKEYIKLYHLVFEMDSTTKYRPSLAGTRNR